MSGGRQLGHWFASYRYRLFDPPRDILQPIDSLTFASNLNLMILAQPVMQNS